MIYKKNKKAFKNKLNAYAVILCGGKSSRMQKNKAFLQVKKENKNIFLYEWQKKRLEKIFKKVFISSKDIYTHNTIQDLQKDFHPLNALLSIKEYFKDYNKNTQIFIIAVDYICVNKNIIKKLYYKNAIAKDTKTHYLCGFYTLEELKLISNNNFYKIKDFATSCNKNTLKIKKRLANINHQFEILKKSKIIY